MEEKYIIWKLRAYQKNVRSKQEYKEKLDKGMKELKELFKK